MGTVHDIAALRPAQAPGATRRGQRLAEVGLVAGLTALGLALRWPGLSAGLRQAESATYVRAATTGWLEALQPLSLRDVDPPGFFLLMHGWTQAFGVSEAALKFPALVAGVLLIPATFVLARHITGSPRASLLAAGATTVAPEAVFTSTDARPAALAAVLACLTVLFYVKSATGSRASLIGLAVCGTAALAVHPANAALVLALILVTGVLWSRQLLRGRTTGLAWTLAGLGIGAGIQAAAFLTSWGATSDAGTAQVDHQSWRPAELASLLPLPPPGWPYDPFRRAAELVMAICLTMAVWRAARAWRAGTRLRPSPRRYTFAMASATFLLTIAVLASMPGRDLFPIAPLGWIVATWLLVTTTDDIRKRWRGPWRAAVLQTVAPLLLLVVLVPDANYAFSLHAAPRSGIRALVNDVRPHAHTETLYVAASEPIAASVAYYLHHHRNPAARAGDAARVAVMPPDRDPLIREAARAGYRRVALIHSAAGPAGVARQAVTAERETTEWLQRELRLLDTRVYEGTLEPARVSVFAIEPSGDALSANRTLSDEATARTAGRTPPHRE